MGILQKPTILKKISDIETSLGEKTNQTQETRINAKYAPVPLVRAKGDNATDDTAAFQGLINYCTTNGYELFIPSGTYLANITVSNSNAVIKGAGSCYYLDGKGTIIRPYDKTKDAVMVGGQANLVTNVTLEDFTVDGFVGEGSHNGVSVIDCWQVYINRVNSYRCSKNNFLIDAVTNFTSGVFVNNFEARYGGISNIMIGHSESNSHWITAARFTNGYLATFGNGDSNTTACSVITYGCGFSFTNVYTDVLGGAILGRGLRIYKTSAYPLIELQNSYFDATTTDDIAVYIDCPKATLSTFILTNKNMINAGRVKFTDGYIKSAELAAIYPYIETKRVQTSIVRFLSESSPDEALADLPYIDKISTGLEIYIPKASQEIYYKCGNGGQHRFYGGSYWTPLYFEYSSNKNWLWYDDNGRLRIKNSATKPSWAKDGVLVQTVSSGATSARPNSATGLEVGFNHFDTTINKPVWLKTMGVQEIDTITVTGACVTSGNINITLNGGTVGVAVLAGDTVGQIGDKIKATVLTNWNTGGTAGTGVVTFTKKLAGVCSAPGFTDGGTGVTASIVVTTAGVNDVWVDATGTTV